MPAERCPWDVLTPGSVRFCEARLCGWVAEPANTASSLGYVVVGLALLRAARTSGDRRLVALAAAEILIGLGSIAFHGSGAAIGELIDQAGMFMLSGLLATYAVGHALRWTPTGVTRLYVSGVALSTLVSAVLPRLGIPLFALQLAGGLGWELRMRHRARDRAPYRGLVQGLAIFLVSFAIWLTDLTGLVCAPDNHVLTGHAVWHLLNAVAIERLYRFYAARA